MEQINPIEILARYKKIGIGEEDTQGDLIETVSKADASASKNQTKIKPIVLLSSIMQLSHHRYERVKRNASLQKKCN